MNQKHRTSEVQNCRFRQSGGVGGVKLLCIYSYPPQLDARVMHKDTLRSLLTYPSGVESSVVEPRVVSRAR
jgi:hypothetical protein